ncbi:MAG: hypothetical protein KDJ29_14030 [Hyphomicrobiales bacterium]|nr:hypothetical protein [Hyphomicrobiales bacterium]
MRYSATFLVTAVLIAASGWIWVKLPPLFWGTVLSEFQLLLPFLAIVIFLSLFNWLTSLAGKES